ncbi:MAG: aspartate aminotransferase family protein, partial [Candidatus Ranarchaeia archaeon]
GAFHGRTLGALSLTWIEKYRTPFQPLIPGVKFVPFNNLEAVKKAITSNTSAIFLEPIQSVAGVIMGSSDYYRGLRELCDDHDILLIFDEVQTGWGRTGANFFGDHFGISPDIITSAKGLGSGIPIGITITTDAIAEHIKAGDHASTFGGGPIACAAAKATLEIIRQNKLVQNAQVLEKYIKKQIPDVLGKGLLLGIPVEDQAKSLSKLISNQIIAGSSANPKSIRLLPPLIVQKNHIDTFLEVISQ